MILALFCRFNLRTVINDVNTRNLRISVRPIRKVTLGVFVLRTRISFSVVVSYRISRRTTIFVFRRVTRIAQVRRSTAVQTRWLFRLTRRRERVLRASSGTKAIRRRGSNVRDLNGTFIRRVSLTNVFRSPRFRRFSKWEKSVSKKGFFATLLGNGDITATSNACIRCYSNDRYRNYTFR